MIILSYITSSSDTNLFAKDLAAHNISNVWAIYGSYPLRGTHNRPVNIISEVRVRHDIYSYTKRQEVIKFTEMGGYTHTDSHELIA